MTSSPFKVFQLQLCHVCITVSTMQIISQYIDQGWSLTPIPSGTKGPKSEGWNRKENQLKTINELPNYHGVGLMHAYSGTMALDIDNWDISISEFREKGIDLFSYSTASDSVIILSGKPGSAKFLYKMPFGLVLPTKKVAREGREAYSFRCGTNEGLSVQDVLPPSIHPSGKPYQWAGLGHWSRLPMIPGPLLSLWYSLMQPEIVASPLPTSPANDASWDEVQAALLSIDPDVSRDEWIQVGMALHYYGYQTSQLDAAFSLWNNWSRTSRLSKYPGEHELLNQWNSFRIDKTSTIKLGTMFHLAEKYGWKRPPIDVDSLFAESEPLSPPQVHFGIRPAPPDVDLSLWPSILATRSQEVADAVGCDSLVPLWAGLGAVCSVVDARSRLSLMDGFEVPPLLWLMTIGDPADKKTPGARPMMSVIAELEKEDRPRYKKELLNWEGTEAAHHSAKNNFIKFAGSPEAILGSTEFPSVPDLPAQPIPLRLTVTDVTSQMLIRIAKDRPRGILCKLDEMSSWCRKMVDRNSGEDRSAWVVSYESDPYEMDRVGTGSIHCENLAVSIWGNIQPRVLKESITYLSADGLLQRFLPAVLRHEKTKLGNPIPDMMTHRAQWDQALRTIYALPVSNYRLSKEAHTEFRKFQEWYEFQKQDERLLLSSDTFMTAFGKIEGTAGRLILLFHLIEKPFSIEVDVDIVRRVVQIIRQFIIPSFRYALGEVGDMSHLEIWLSDYIIHHCDKGQLTLTELRRAAKNIIRDVAPWKADQMILGGMYVLELARWVKRLDDGSLEVTKRHAEWAIDPSLSIRFKEHRDNVIKAKQRWLDGQYEKALLNGKPRKMIDGYRPEIMD